MQGSIRSKGLDSGSKRQAGVRSLSRSFSNWKSMIKELPVNCCFSGNFSNQRFISKIHIEEYSLLFVFWRILHFDLLKNHYLTKFDVNLTEVKIHEIKALSSNALTPCNPYLLEFQGLIIKSWMIEILCIAKIHKLMSCRFEVSRETLNFKMLDWEKHSEDKGYNNILLDTIECAGQILRVLGYQPFKH